MSWQDGVVLALVALAAGYLGRVVWTTLRGKKDCGCGAKSSCAAAKPKPNVVSIELLGDRESP